MNEIDWIAVTLAAASAFMLGGVWYAKPVFGARWSAAAKVPEQPGHPAKVFGGAFAFSFIAAALFASLLGPDSTPARGLELGLIVGAGFAATSFGINYLFAQRPMVLLLIDGGYHTLQFALYGLIIGKLG